MRTLDEVIKAVEEDLECANVSYPEVFYDYDNHKDALHYLKEYQILQTAYIKTMADLEDNPPLTWDELKDMIGKPIWIEMEEIGFWYIILNFEEGKGFDDYMMTSPFIQWWKSELGTVWNAYRKERS